MGLIAVAFYETSWFKAVVYVLIAFIAARVVDFFLARRDAAIAKLLGKTPGRADHTRYVMIRRLVQAVILIIGVAMALFQFPFFQTLSGAILASAAIISGVIGIAARAPLANLVSGVMITFSQPVRLGDYISVGDVYGTVEEIRFTYTYIRTPDDCRVVIPNEVFASQVVQNFSMGSTGSMVAVDFVVPVAGDVDAVCAAVLEIADKRASAPEGKSNSITVEELGATTVALRLHAWAHDPLVRRELASDLRAAIVRRLRDDGVLGATREASDADN
ncbi:MAG: mechanosensitive ion channel family protein [Actinobacteria bacterium]|nr:mechanosensitive ion channel family protein [Actinomycetota bacterium]